MRHLSLALFLLATSCATFPVYAQGPQCAPRDTIITQLQEKYGETQQALALVNPSQLIEFWANVETGTWTQLLSNIDGTSCIIFSGGDWSLAPRPVFPQGRQI